MLSMHCSLEASVRANVSLCIEACLHNLECRFPVCDSYRGRKYLFLTIQNIDNTSK